MLKEFKEFAMRGNVLDMAIGIIVGGAFGKIVSSAVSDILMPPLGLLLGKVAFTGLFLNLSGQPQPSLAAAKAAGAPTINYGVFLQTILDFMIIAFVIFLLVKQVNRLTRKPEVPPGPPDHEGLPSFPSNDSDQSHTLRALYLRGQGGVVCEVLRRSGQSKNSEYFYFKKESTMKVPVE